MLTECEQLALLDCQDETERLVLSNLDLANYIAHRYRWTGEDLEDLIQSAREGLVKAAKGYKPESGAKFSSYAYITMKRVIHRSLFGNPDAPKNQINPTIVSLQMPISEDGYSYTLQDILPDDANDCIERKLDLITLEECFGNLSDKEKFVLHQRYVEEKKWRDIGASLGTSHEWARNVEKRAMKRIRGMFG